MNQELDAKLAQMIREQSAQAKKIAEDGRKAVEDVNARVAAVKAVKVQIPNIPKVVIPKIPKF